MTELMPSDLPLPVRTVLAAHAVHDAERALPCFAPDAEVVDDGRTYRGTAEVRAFLESAGSEYTYTSTLVRAERLDDAVWVAHHHVEGDFPGGVVDLAYRFELAGDLVARLAISA